MPKEILSLIYLIALSFNSFAETKLEGKLEPFLGKPSLEIQPVFKGERFGNIAVTMDGTVLATWGTTHVRASLVLIGRCREEENLNPSPSYSECLNCGSERGFQMIRQGFPPSIHYECKDCRAIR